MFSKGKIRDNVSFHSLEFFLLQISYFGHLVVEILNVDAFADELEIREKSAYEEYKRIRPEREV